MMSMLKCGEMYLNNVMVLTGAIYRKELIRLLKMAVAVAPEIMSMTLLQLLDPVTYTKALTDKEFRSTLPEMCPETIFWFDMNIDGVTLFKAGKLPQVIIFNWILFYIDIEVESYWT